MSNSTNEIRAQELCFDTIEISENSIKKLDEILKEIESK